MGSEILYLDGSRDRAVEKAIRKHGKVYYAKDINEAVELIADREFDYYFLDADTPCVRELLAHLEHDPYFIPPKAFVLLTDNEAEDCAAWKVDTFITRRRVKEDIPFVFSHHVGQPPDNTGVLKLVKREDERDDMSREEHLTSEVPTCVEDTGRYELMKEAGRSVDRDEGFPKVPGDRSIFNSRESGTKNKPKEKSAEETHSRSFPIRLIAVGALTLALAVLLYAFIPIGAGSAKKGSTGNQDTKVEAEAADEAEGVNDKHSIDFIYGDDQMSPDQQVTASPPIAGDDVREDAAVIDQNREVPPAEANVAPSNSYSSPQPAAPVNRPPSVSISGPVQVSRGQTATYTAVASDPDGDAISYSWGSSSRNMSWSAPGLFNVSITVTDSRGASGSASISVRVI